jgi:hypothetical protein
LQDLAWEAALEHIVAYSLYLLRDMLDYHLPPEAARLSASRLPETGAAHFAGRAQKKSGASILFVVFPFTHDFAAGDCQLGASQRPPPVLEAAAADI